MAGIPALLGSIATSRTRSARTIEAAFSNHFIVFAALLFGLHPAGNAFLPSLIGFLLLVPLCADPGVPKERLDLLPLTWLEKGAVAGAILVCNPALWVALLLPVIGGRSYLPAMELILLVALVVILGAALGRRMLARQPGWNLLCWVPPLPGQLGPLVRMNLRELLRRLDFYLALALALAGTAYRVLSPGWTREVGQGCTLLVALALSSSAQNLFGAERAGAMDRYRLLPIRGWQCLLAKDLAFMGVLMLLTLPLDAGSGLTGGLVILAIGHRPSVRRQTPHPPWRFAAGTSAAMGMAQVAALFIATGLCRNWLVPTILVALGGFLVSLAIAGRNLEGPIGAGQAGRNRAAS